MNAPLPATTWTTGTTEVFKTGTWRAALPRYQHVASPCHQACPVSGEIADWIGLALARDFRGAWQVLTRHNPFPAVAGRVCHHPCEAACNRGAYDEAVSICKLERLIGDMALAQGWTHDPAREQRDGHVAIVGGGPSGLSAAYHLRRLGWRVTIYEQQNELGGLMRFGIPAYRLDRAVLDAEIARILALGVDVKHDSLATAQDLERLRAGHDAVYVAIGAGKPKRLPQLPAQATWLMDGAEYLARTNSGAPPTLGKRVVVIGGGSAALDAARSARRAGHAVTILALERAAQMPAQRAEVAEALEEGIALADGAMLKSVTQDLNGLVLHCQCVFFDPGPVRGQFKIEPMANSEFTLEADSIVTSIGQDPNLAALAAALPAEGGLLVTDARQATATGNVWAGGDVASMARFVTEAIGMGQRAALDIDRALRALPVPQDEAPQAAVAIDAIALHHHPKQARAAEQRRSVAERVGSSVEVQLGLALEQALAEAARCFSCGRCTQCDNCFFYCPDLAIQRVPGGYTVLTDYCKGCGMCVKECPTGSISMYEEIR